jgi:hypothetical protein
MPKRWMLVAGLTCGLGFILGICVPPVWRERDPAVVWGKYYESLYALRFAIQAHDDLHARAHAAANTYWFDRLKERHLIAPITYNWKDPAEQAAFVQDTSSFIRFRPGMSNEGGMWPVGIEYVEDQALDCIPVRFGGRLPNREANRLGH